MDSRSIFEPRPIEDVIRSAFDDVNMQQIAIFARLTPAERAQIMFDVIEQERQKMFAEERAQYPDESAEAIWRRVRDRILDQQDLSDKVRADLNEWMKLRGL